MIFLIMFTCIFPHPTKCKIRTKTHTKRHEAWVFRPLSFLSPPLAKNLVHKSPIFSAPTPRSVIKPFSHLFSSSSSATFFSSAFDFSVISLADFSKACSRCFFLTRKRADAAVLRLRLSSSASTRARSVGGSVISLMSTSLRLLLACC